MATIMEIIPRLEGLSGIAPSTTDVSTELLTFWVEQMKDIMRNDFRKDFTDWEFQALNDIGVAGYDQTNSATVVLAAAGTVYGLLFRHDASDSEAPFVTVTDATSDTFDGAGTIQNDQIVLLQLPAAATDNTEEFHAFSFMPGLICATGIVINADGRDGTPLGDSELDGWILYRDRS